MSVRETGKKNRKFPQALPCFSADSEEAALCIVATLCRLNYDGSYVLPNFDGTIDAIDALTELLEHR